MNDLNENNNKFTITPLFAFPLMQVQLDLDLEKLTELAFEMRNKDKKGVQLTNYGGWQSNDIIKETHEEFIRLKKEINRHLQIYHSAIFSGMKFKENITQNLESIWINISEKHHYNEWHVHLHSILSGVYYINHDGSEENGDIVFKHPNGTYINIAHWPPGLVETWDATSAEILNITPSPNMLLIFPSWLEHKVEMNLKDDTRISLSFNSQVIPEKKS